MTDVTKYLTPQQSQGWRKKIEACATRACTPLKFARAMGDDMALPMEVVRNDQGQVVVHIFRRPDVPAEKAEPVALAALLEVFGPPTPGMRDADGQIKGAFYRDETEIMRLEGLTRPVLPTDSWYLEFPAEMSMILPDAEGLRDRLALAVRRLWLAL